MRTLWLLSVALVGQMCVSAIVPIASAGEPSAAQPSAEERAQRRAEILRERAAAQARAQLGLPSFHTSFEADPQLYAPNRYLDYLALGSQMARIAAMLNATAGCLVGAHPCQSYGDGPALPPSPAGPDTGGAWLGAPPPGALAPAYGPAGPTVESVRALLAYRLVVAGNPRLVVGEVSEDGGQVVAEVVTKDGSLVERYTVDMRTGVWRTQH